jgi:hypothetical protein
MHNMISTAIKVATITAALLKAEEVVELSVGGL